MTLKSVKMPLAIIFIMVLMCDLHMAFYFFFNVYWIDFIEGPADIEVATVFTWMDGIGLFLIISLSVGLGFLTYRSWVPKEKLVNLKAIRTPTTIISGLVFMYDLFFIYNTLFHKGWPATEEGEALEGFPFVSYWVGEILILLILIAFQTGLGILTYRAWVTKPRQPQTT